MVQHQTSEVTHGRVSIVTAAAVALALLPRINGQPMAASFTRIDTTFTDKFDVGPAGATFRVPLRGLPTDGVSVQIPANSLAEAITLSIGYCTGSLRLKAGTPSGTVLVLRTSVPLDFRYQITIEVSFPPNPKHKLLVGYEIDAEGRLRPIDLINLDMKQGRVSFLTFHAITLTWVYID